MLIAQYNYFFLFELKSAQDSFAKSALFFQNVENCVVHMEVQTKEQ